MGDGYFKKVGSKTTRISIAFDDHSKWEHLKNICTDVLDILKIKWFKEPKVSNSCCMIGFVVPDVILDSLGVLFSGAKYNAQPYPVEIVIQNINFATGLLNSDGCVDKRYLSYHFINTVETITRALSKCLTFNGIEHRVYNRKGTLDKRTGNISKKQYNIYIPAKNNNAKELRKLSKYICKGEK